MIQNKDLIEGEIYYCKVFGNPYLFEYRKNKTKNIKHLQCNKEYFSNWGWDFWTDKTCIFIQQATKDQIHWLNECIKLDKYISFDEALLTFDDINIIQNDPELHKILIKLLTT